MEQSKTARKEYLMKIDRSIPLEAPALDASDLNIFLSDGILMHRWRLREQHIRVLLEQLSMLAGYTESVALEADGKTPRAFHGGYEQNVALNNLTRLDAVLRPVQQILRDDVYVYQFKVNLKAAFVGDIWPWHQDYSFWSKEDQMPAPRAVTVGIFLDDVTEFNGPIYFIRASHRSGCHDIVQRQSDKPADDNWLRHVGASLSYQTDPRKVTHFASLYGMLAPKGRRGTILFFDCNVIHASPPNISPIQRRIIFITYNSVHNVPVNARRPAFLVNRNVSPLEPLDGRDLIELVTG
jgi:ectoine hydroxylase